VGEVCRTKDARREAFRRLTHGCVNESAIPAMQQRAKALKTAEIMREAAELGEEISEVWEDD
jgi:hypothetical protein